MPIIQEVDNNRNLYKNTAFKTGNGFTNKLPKAYHQGGFVDFTSIANLINNNKDLIKSTVDLGKAIHDTVKTSQELKKIKSNNNNNNKSSVKKTEYTLTPEEEKRFNSFAGNGFKKI